jgi:hypothetical protein
LIPGLGNASKTDSVAPGFGALHQNDGILPPPELSRVQFHFYRTGLSKSHPDCWGSQLLDHVLREHAVLDLIDGFSALVGQVLES